MAGAVRSKLKTRHQPEETRRLRKQACKQEFRATEHTLTGHNKNNGEQVVGTVVNLSGDSVQLNTDLADPNQRTGVDRKEVKSIEPSKVSPMPPMLLMMLKKEEILDLMAYVLSGGDKSNAMFQP